MLHSLKFHCQVIAEVESTRLEQDAKLLLMSFEECEAPGPALKLMVRCKPGLDLSGAPNKGHSDDFHSHCK